MEETIIYIFYIDEVLIKENGAQLFTEELCMWWLRGVLLEEYMQQVYNLVAKKWSKFKFYNKPFMCKWIRPIIH